MAGGGLGGLRAGRAASQSSLSGGPGVLRGSEDCVVGGQGLDSCLGQTYRTWATERGPTVGSPGFAVHGGTQVLCGAGRCPWSEPGGGWGPLWKWERQGGVGVGLEDKMVSPGTPVGDLLVLEGPCLVWWGGRGWRSQ